MRFYFLFIVLLIPIFLNAQDEDLSKNKSLLNLSNERTSKAERLKFLDSLSGEIRYDSTFNADSIFRVTISFAQKLDSINIAVKHTTNFINYLNYGTNEYDEAKEIIKSTIPILSQVTKPNLIDDFYYEAAYLHYDSRHFEESIKLFDSSYVYAEKYQSEYMELSKFAKGMALLNTGDFGAASITLQEASKMFQEKKDTVYWLSAKNSISILYSKNGFFEEAKKERDELIKIANTTHSYHNLPVVYYNNAADDHKLNNQKSRIKNLKLAVEANDRLEKKAYFDVPLKFGLAVGLAENDSLKQAKAIIEDLERDENSTIGYNRPFYLAAKMRYAFAEKNYTEAIRYGIENYELKNESDQYEELQEASLFLSKVYERMGDPDKAFSHYKKYTQIKDSIGSSQNTRVLAYYQTIYETEKRDLTIQNQTSNIALLDTKNKVKNQWLMFGGLGLLSVFGFVTVVRSRNFAKNKQKLQEAFTQDIINTQEQERTRLAFELHDSVGQQLMLLTRKLKTIDNPDYGNLANDTLANLRSISQGLYPAALERLGFTAAIEDLVNELDEGTDVFFTLEIENTDNLINKDKALHLYRITQEALNNTIKHAEAKAVFVSLETEANHIVMTIKDNGKGFDYNQAIKTSKSLGMKSLMERCKIISAKLEVESAIGKGTKIVIKLPIEIV
ncbi:tetratricopeptide repeat-containing sensor histidine kinase [Bizionia myxarmorum]|uniref:histidine kinase n=1 Tax=Bizionia myxarmorum TaxID=291186 RepID=A0A5D0RFB4_9FLAO|nr:sensor histidine kinase [Bizionia myxarmorum]TYB79739.1 sensor histidine kinase [Bizionia myxarmorum]